MVICLERGANDLYMVQLMLLPPCRLFINIQIDLTFMVPVYQGCPVSAAVERVSCQCRCDANARASRFCTMIQNHNGSERHQIHTRHC